jgi:hypothetical protein
MRYSAPPAAVYALQDIRQGDIVLRTPLRRFIFVSSFGGIAFVGGVLLILAMHNVFAG